jgi:Na+(H+)/acetate symporter ActP
MSTAPGLLLVISSSISRDLLKGVFARGIGEKAELLAGRIAILIAGYLAWVVSRLTTAPPEHIQHLVEDIRVPRGAALAPAGH